MAKKPPDIGPYDGQWNLANPLIPPIDQPIWFPQNPWGNDHLDKKSCSNKQCLRLPSNIIYEPANQWLKIRTTDTLIDGYPFTSGKLFSNALRNTYQYGYFEIVCKIPSGYGIGAAFWLLAEQTDTDSTVQEIDIFEFKGWQPELLPTNFHKAGDNTHGSDVRVFPPGSPTNFANTFNTIGLEWTPTTLTWYVNGVPVRRVTNHDISQPMNIIVDVNCPYGGACPVTASFPNYYYIKSVAWYSRNPAITYFESTDCQARLNLVRSFSDWRTTWSAMIPGDFDNDKITDVFLYDRAAGVGHFYNSSGTGATITGLRTTWDIIVPGDFHGGTGNTDLLFYDREAGQAQVKAVTSQGAMIAIGDHENWRTTWSLILPGDFDSDQVTDLLFYDRNDGVGYFKRTNAPDLTYTGWRKTWDRIIPGRFGGDTANTDLLFYDRTAQQGQFHSISTAGSMESIGPLIDGWRSTWTDIVPGTFAFVTASGPNTDLLFYDAPAGHAEFFTVRHGQLASVIRAYDDWRHTWKTIAAGNFDGTGCSDLLLYDPD